MSSISKKIKTSALTYGLYRLGVKLLPDRTRAFIFVATTGRSGSNSLTTILGVLKNCASFHEPHPLMGDNSPAGADRAAYYKKLFHQRKLPTILMASRRRDYYVETNHQFIKHFAEHAIDAFGDRIRIIHLVRDPIRVATSFFAINSVPGLSSKGRKYLLDPLAPDNLIQIQDLLGSPDFSHEFYRCLWYWYEVEARAKRIRSTFPKIKWHTLKTEELNDLDALKAMFKSLELPVTDDLSRVVSTRENTKAAKKLRNIDPKEAEQMHSRLLKEITKRHGSNFWM